MYKKCYVGNKYRKGLPNVWEMHVWESDGEHKMIPYENKAYIEDEDSFTCRGLNGEKLRPTSKWYYNRNKPESNTPNLHFHDMKPHQKYLIETYGTDDKPSTGHQELFYDIECEIGGALTEEYIEKAPMPITSIAFWHKQTDSWGCLILDPKGQVKKQTEGIHKVIPFKTEAELLLYWVEIIQKVQPDILIGYNSDYFDNPYTYYRICNVCGKDIADQMSPLYGKVREPVKSKKYSQWFFKQGMSVDVVGIESLDYMRLHRKYSFKD